MTDVEPKELEIHTEAAVKTGAVRTFAAFAHRNYQLWFFGQLVSLAGTWMQSIAQGWLVYQISHSDFALGLVGFAGAIPILIITPFGGLAFLLGWFLLGLAAWRLQLTA